MSKRKEWFQRISFILVLCLMLTGGKASVCFAEDYGDEIDEAELTIYSNGEVSDTTITAGNQKEIIVPITADYQAGGVRVYKVSVSGKDMKVVGTPKVYNKDNKETNSIDSANYFLHFTVEVNAKAESGIYDLQPSFLVKMYGKMKTVKLLDTIPIYVEAKKDVKTKGNIEIDDVECEQGLTVGQTSDLTYTIKNIGDGKATDISVTYDGFGDDGLLPTSGNSAIKISSLEPGDVEYCSIPVKVSSNAVTGAKKITITASYRKNSAAEEMTTETDSIYVEVKGKTEKKASTSVKAPKIVLKSVKQSVEEPKAGEPVSVSFTVVNMGQKLAKNIMITPSNLSNTNFTPMNTDPTIYIKSLKSGGKKRVTMDFIVSKNVESGLAELDLATTYKDSKGTEASDTNKLYIRNVKAKEESNAGVPKLIIQSYGTQPGVVKAGQAFSFNFDILNTHSSLQAENIKVTVSSEDGTFSVAKGSNSFYIKTVQPGEVYSQKVPLKVKADSTTKSYPIKVQFEYEYKGMQKPENAITPGLTVDEVLNIQVEEDANATLTNIIAGPYGELINGEVNTVTFDVTNRGKSPLYNVEAVITGDFQPTQEVYFIGAVAAGSGTNHEMEITPTTEGTATGYITLTYEDSNGKKKKIKQKFTGEVMSGGGQSDIIDDNGEVDPGMGDLPEAKKEIVSLPIFIVIQVVLFFAGMIVVRKIRISLYKKKLRRLEESQE